MTYMGKPYYPVWLVTASFGHRRCVGDHLVRPVERGCELFHNRLIHLCPLMVVGPLGRLMCYPRADPRSVPPSRVGSRYGQGVYPPRRRQSV